MVSGNKAHMPISSSFAMTTNIQGKSVTAYPDLTLCWKYRLKNTLKRITLNELFIKGTILSSIISMACSFIIGK